jgi:hypothetical protein
MPVPVLRTKVRDLPELAKAPLFFFPDALLDHL